MSATSPGPWTWEPGDSTIEGANGAVCHMAEHANERTVMATGEYFNSADARLIAAAPELMAMLKLAVEGVHAGGPWVEMAAHLIARIEGE